MENGGYNLSPHKSDFATVDELQLAYLSITPNHCQSSALHTTWPQVITFDLSSAVLTLSRRSALAPRSSSSSFLLCIFLISIVDIHVSLNTYPCFPLFCIPLDSQTKAFTVGFYCDEYIYPLSNYISFFIYVFPV